MSLSQSSSEIGPIDPYPDEPRVFTCYPLITIFAKDDAEAAAKIRALDEYINGLDGVSTEMTEECYRLGFDNQDDGWGGWDVPLGRYPTKSQAAKMIGVATSTLTRRRDVITERRGDRDHVLRPGEVLRLGRIYRRRSINEVAAALVDFAPELEPECHAFFAAEVARAA